MSILPLERRKGKLLFSVGPRRRAAIDGALNDRAELLLAVRVERVVRGRIYGGQPWVPDESLAVAARWRHNRGS